MKKIIIGLVGSGKTTLYRKLNEEQQCNAVEIELPQSCIGDEQLKSQIFNLFYYSNNIDVIIVHPFFLPQDFVQRLTKDDKIVFLDMPLADRKKQIQSRNRQTGNNCQLFDDNFLIKEEQFLQAFKINLKNFL